MSHQVISFDISLVISAAIYFACKCAYHNIPKHIYLYTKSITMNNSDLDVKAVTATFGGNYRTPKPDESPSELEFKPTDAKEGQEWSVISIVLNNPEVVVKVAKEDPSVILNGKMPYGLIKILFIGSKEKCKKYERKLLDANKFHRLTRVKTGYWIPITGNCEDTEIVESKSREILYAELTESRSKQATEKRNAMRRFALSEDYEKRKENKGDVMHYAQMQVSKHINEESLLNAQKIVSSASKNLSKLTTELEQLELSHPEFIDTWRSALDKYCDDMGISNPFGKVTGDFVSAEGPSQRDSPTGI
jgi:hypothetical protein